jgi:hypothetical protein
MSIEVSPEIEARLVDEARKHGISVDVLLQQLLSERGPVSLAGTGPAPELPVWHLGEVGPLHRRDIYDDVP